MRKENYNQSIHDITQQLVRYYRIPVARNKEDVLDTIFISIEHHKAIKKSHKIQLSPASLATLAAAVVAVLLALHLFTARVTFSGRNGENTAYRLPDHSRVVLHNNSNVRVGKYVGKRKLTLEGTAYFEVEKGSKFRVKTNLGTIEVLGTRFLVSERNDSLDVQCYSGRVKTKTNHNSFVLEPGRQYSGTEKSGQKVALKTQREYPQFAEFNRSFPDIALNKVMEQLATFFGVQIDLQNGNERRFSGTIQTGKLESALEIVCQSMQLKYRYANKYRVEIFK